jgi:protein-S-isoprenylcysteine O-methyltransferase Ste14
MSKTSVYPETGAGTNPRTGHSGRKMSLGAQVAFRLPIALIVTAAILFLPAGTLNFWQGWAVLAAYLVPANLIFLYFLKTDPQVIERRMERKEPVREQKLLMKWFKLFFLVAALIPGFDRRWSWSRRLFNGTPLWLSLLSLALIPAAFLFVFWVVKVNRFAARTIRVEKEQTVISNGPYRWVRHPMYSGSVVLFIVTPLALGSYVALPLFALLLIPLFVIRLLNEEKVLRKELPGYAEYCNRTRYRLVPFVW